MTRGAALLAAVLLAAPAAGAVLRVTLTPSRPPQGGVVRVLVKSDAPLSTLVLVDGERRIPLSGDAEGRSFTGLLGVDFEAAPGKRLLRFDGRDAAGGETTTPATLTIAARRFAVQKLTVDPKFVEPPPEAMERIERDRAEFARAFASSRPGPLWLGGFRRPAEGELRGNFGARRVYNGLTTSRHAGRDVAAPPGAPVVAAAGGRVALAGEFYFSGGSVVVDHGDSLFTMYFHLSRLDVKEGDEVAAGQRVGAVGATGRVTGPHLHWAARLSGARVDPAALLALPARP
ncbi:MAG: M23 family metallopeptidase [Thermoanaerobaculia bacterium]